MRRKPKRDYTPVTVPVTFNGNYELTNINSHGLLDDALDQLFTGVREELHASLTKLANGEEPGDAAVEAQID